MLAACLVVQESRLQLGVCYYYAESTKPRKVPSNEATHVEDSPPGRLQLPASASCLPGLGALRRRRTHEDTHMTVTKTNEDQQWAIRIELFTHDIGCTRRLRRRRLRSPGTIRSILVFLTTAG